MEFISDFCPLSATFGFLIGFGWCWFTAAAEEIYNYFLERKKIKRLRRDSLKCCPVCGSYVGSSDTFCCECGSRLIDQ